MLKTIFLTGATDGIGLVTAKTLAADGHHLLIHGRNSEKLASVRSALMAENSGAKITCYQADLAELSQVATLAETITKEHQHIDVLINNAGVFAANNPVTAQGYDLRLVVNTLAPYLLAKKLLPLLNENGRIVNLSSAAQAPVNLQALTSAKQTVLSDNAAYAQSKLALTMWTYAMAAQRRENHPLFVSINPKSFLGSKMVQEAYGVAGSDLSVGADILIRAALSDEFSDANGKYFDNDIASFANPHPDGFNNDKCIMLANELDDLLVDYLS